MPDQTSPEQTATPDPARTMQCGSCSQHKTVDKLRAELARVRPVVDAARAWRDSPSEDSDSADALLDAVAALDGDAAATPQPAGENVWPGYEHLADLHEQLTDVISDHYPTPDHVDAQTPAGTLAALLLPSIHAKVIGLVADEVNAWQVKIRAEDAASSAPPVDVHARVRAAAHAAFTAMDKGVLMSEDGDGAESVLTVGHLHLIAEYLERHPDWPSAQAIVRALATPTTEES